MAQLKSIGFESENDFVAILNVPKPSPYLSLAETFHILLADLEVIGDFDPRTDFFPQSLIGNTTNVDLVNLQRNSACLVCQSSISLESVIPASEELQRTPGILRMWFSISVG